MDKQESFDFPVDQPVGRPTEPLPKIKVPRVSTSLCSWCGRRMDAALMDSTPQVDHDTAWAGLSVYHAEGCQWIKTRGLRLTDAEAVPQHSAQDADAAKQPTP